MGFGYIPDIMDERDYKFRNRKAPSRLVPINPRPDVRASMPPVWDQGMHGSCVLHAVGARFVQHAIQMAAAGKWPKSRIWTPSFLQMYYDVRALEGTIALDNGCMPRNAIKVMSQSRTVGKGVAPAKHWAYASDGPEDVADEATWIYPATSRAIQKPSATTYRSARLHQITEYRRVDNTNHAEVMQCLSEGRSVALGFMVYRNSMYDRQGYPRPIITMPTMGDRGLGGHEVIAVSANDTADDWDMGGGFYVPKHHYLMRNSWGTATQMHGHFAMPFGYAENTNLCDDFWDILGSEQ